MSTPTVPFLDLSRHTARHRQLIDAALGRVVERGRFVLGEECERFEAAFARFCGATHCVGVASGTDAIAIALQAAGVRPGDEVVTAANTCVPTIVGIEGAGAVPVLADVDPETLTLDPARVAEAVTPRTRAIVPVHLYGRPAAMDALLELARDRGLLVVEDCAQAHGAESDGRRAGSIGHAAAFSFYPTKNLGALGDGGAVVTSDPEVAGRARLLHNYGETERFRHELRGRNSRLDEAQAAVLHDLLPLVDGWNARRRDLAARYTEALAGSPVVAPAGDDGHVYHLYVVRPPDREPFRAALSERGVGTAVQYPLPIHRQPAYRDLAPTGRSLRFSEEACDRVTSLPLHPELRDDEADAVVSAVRAVA